MKTPGSLETLVDYGIIQEVVRPLMSGKEAQVYVVLAGGEERVAKVYKEAHERTFKHRTEYTEGRRTRNSRDERAMQKRTRHGRKQDEAAWRSAEIDTIYRLHAGGVRVPEPIHFIDGVLVMELVQDSEGAPAPRLGDLSFRPDEAEEIHQKLMREVVRMLCAGIVHGDLSEFNVLMGANGPVVIDFPQSVDAAKNPSARKLLLRDVENLNRFLSRFAPQQAIRPFGEEIWALYEKNRLDPETPLTGGYVAPSGPTRMDDLMALIDDASQDERMRRDARGDETPLERPQPVRRVVDFTQENAREKKAERKRRPGPRAGARPGSSPAGGGGPRGPSTRARTANATANASSEDVATSGERRRRRRRSTGAGPDPDQSAARSGRPEPPTGPAASRGPRRSDRRPQESKKAGSDGPSGEPRRRRRRRRSPGSQSS
jgi:RIO kinase 1